MVRTPDVLTPPAVGSSAPDVTLPLADRATAPLSSYWAGTRDGLVLVFLRHFGCIFCREHVAQLSVDYSAFLERGYEILTIGHGTAERAARFRADLGLPFPVLGDWDQHAYAAYGLGRARYADLVNPKIYVAAAKLTLSGTRGGKPDGDVRQLPGTFVISPGGMVQFSRPAGIASDFVSTRELLAWIDASARVQAAD